jgi:AcrR family transcriptional regulator
MARRSEHSQDELKEMVLKAAETIIIEEGFSELKVRKIAMEIGYTVGSIYMVFGNVADLIMHINGRTLDDLKIQLKQVIKQDNAELSIMQLAKTYVSFATEHSNRWSTIFEHRLAENEVKPDWYQQKIDTIFSLVESQFQSLSAMHSDEQGKLAARALWSGVHGICILTLSGKTDLIGNDVEKSVVLLVDTFIKGWKI